MTKRSWLYSTLFLLCWTWVVLSPWINSRYFGANWHTEWGKYGIPAMLPEFADLRGITNAADCWHMGSSLYESNPCSPFGLRYNYPKYLLYLHFLGVSGETTFPIGVALIIFFVSSIFYIVGKLNLLEATYWTYICSTMPVLLAIERGNHDMLAFSALAVSLLFLNKNKLLGYGALFFATTIKIFPFFSYGVALREHPKTLVKIWAALGTLTAILFYLSWSDIQAIRAATPDSPVFSFGLRRLSPSIDLLLQSSDHYVIISVIILALILLLLGLFWLFKDKFTPGLYTHKNLDSFRIGAFILIGTWLSSVHFCYRLIFILFLVPFFLNCIRGKIGERILGIFGITFVALTLRFESLAWGTARGLDEISVTLLVIISGALLIATLPFLNRNITE